MDHNTEYMDYMWLKKNIGVSLKKTIWNNPEFS